MKHRLRGPALGKCISEFKKSINFDSWENFLDSHTRSEVEAIADLFVPKWCDVVSARGGSLN